MKILFCNKYNFPFSGTEVYLFELMETLRSRGHEVRLFSTADLPSDFVDRAASFVGFKSENHSLWECAMLAGHAIYSVDARRALRRVIHEFRPDLAHVRNIYHHLSPSILWELRAQHVPVLYHLNDFKLVCPSYNLVLDGKACERCRGGQFWHVITSGCYRHPLGASSVLAAEAYFHRALQSYAKCVTKFLAPSHFVRDKLIENGWDPQKIEVLSHPQIVPNDVPTPPPDDSPILYFGRLSPEKGLVHLLHAMQKLPNITLKIAGDGPQRAELQNLVQQLALKNVNFVGHLSKSALDRMIAGVRFTIFPSLAYETLGKSILESYALARPVVATDLGSRREFVIHNVTGLLYAPGDCGKLASAIWALYSEPARADVMGLAGYEMVRERHAPEQHYEALMQLYTRLTSGQRSLGRAEEPRPLRVAFIGARGVGSKYSGIETWYEQVGGRLAANNHKVTAYCRSYFTPSKARYLGIDLVRLPTIRTKHMDTLVHSALSTVHAMFGRYDVVHYHALGPALFSFLPRLTGKKTVVTVQGLDWQRRKWGRLAATVLRAGERAASALPNSTIVVSRTLQDFYQAKYGARTAYIPNGTELRPRTSQGSLEQWSLESDRYILFLGRFSPEKNCDLLIRAFEPIETDVKLVLAGGSSYSDAYSQKLRCHQNSRILLLDWVSGAALEELLTNAMLFVLPSDLEGLSLALLDAMSAGICVLTSDVPENRELVEGAGFMFRRGDEDDLRNKICDLIANPDLRAQAGRAAVARIKKNYQWDAIARQVEAEYRRVLGWPPDNCVPVLHETTKNAA